MIRWIPYTFVRTVLFFIGGIVLGIYQPNIISQFTAQVVLIAFVFIYIIAFILFRVLHKPLFNLGFIALPAVFLAGYVHLIGQTASMDKNHFINVTVPINYYQAVITRYPEEKDRSWKIEARVLKVFTKEWMQQEGKVLLYISKETLKVPFQYGDVLLIKGPPVMVQSPSNPGEFDYKQFLSFRNIYHQHFLQVGNVRWIKNDPPSKIIHYAIQARLWADNTLKKYVKGLREQAIASALVLGVTDGLDNELLNAYAATGAMHVLAVSGLHISIIYMLLMWILRPLHRLKAGPWILALTSLFVLWSYAFITGLSPSVLRAVTMFSFIAIARPASQTTNIYNTLAASAFCLLLFDPFLIMSVGFQLSYLAVLGIVYLQPAFYRLWEPESYFADQVWKITCVSIAAQIATFSLGLLYFHQFPNYFMLSNLLVIPGSFLVLVSGIVVLAISFIPAVAGFIGLVLTWFIKAINFVVFMVEAFPYSLIENIHITVFQCWLLMALIIIFILLLERKQFNYSLAAMFVVMIYSIVQWQHHIENINVQKMTVYKVHGHSAIDLMDRGHAYFLTDSVLRNDADKIRFHIRPNRLLSGISKTLTEQQPFIGKIPGGEIIIWNKHIILWAKEKGFSLPKSINPDYIVVANNAIANLALLGKLQPKTKIILDSSNSYFYCERILNDARGLNYNIYSVMHQGAFNFTFDRINT